jgi:alkylation response protein AidB-like acyl-CoA dehydrogenase
MDLRVSDSEAGIRAEARDWLQAFLPADYRARFAQYRLDVEFRRAYQQAAFEAGWLVPGWPRELGGRELTALQELFVKVDFARLGAPKLPNVQGPGVIAPALREFGNDEQRFHLVPVLRGDEWWCLGMSEPDAGSDLAALRTRAVSRGDAFVIDGQKVWTSHASESRYCLLFARTSDEGSKHRGISALIVPMDAPGITVRQIRKVGMPDEEFFEVFFDSVAVPKTALLGEEGDGWRVAMNSLSHERDMIWIMNLVEIERALEISRSLTAGRVDPTLTRDLARLEADAEAIWLTGLRGVTSRARGVDDTVSGILKLFASETMQRAYLLAAEAAGPRAVLTGEDGPFDGEIPAGDLDALGATIYGGTSEVQRNIIGERMLGLPR